MRGVDDDAAKAFLIKTFGLRAEAQAPVDKRIRRAAKQKFFAERKRILDEMREQFGNDNQWTRIFAEICAELDQEQQSESLHEQPPVTPEQEQTPAESRLDQQPDSEQGQA